MLNGNFNEVDRFEISDSRIATVSWFSSSIKTAVALGQIGVTYDKNGERKETRFRNPIMLPDVETLRKYIDFLSFVVGELEK